MKKELKEYLHLYLGCECLVETGIETQPIKLTGISYDEGELWCHFENTETGYALVEDVKAILRPLSDMTEEEMKELLLVLLNNPEGEKDDQIDLEELGDIEIFYNDGGNMVDDNVSVGANFSVRCLEGQFCITTDGSPSLWNLDEDKPMMLNNQQKIMIWLLSRYFDLFNLIETNQAIKKQ